MRITVAAVAAVAAESIQTRQEAAFYVKKCTHVRIGRGQGQAVIDAIAICRLSPQEAMCDLGVWLLREHLPQQ